MQNLGKCLLLAIESLMDFFLSDFYFSFLMFIPISFFYKQANFLFTPRFVRNIRGCFFTVLLSFYLFKKQLSSYERNLGQLWFNETRKNTIRFY